MTASRLLSVDSVAIAGDALIVRGFVAVKLAELVARELSSTRLRPAERAHLHVAHELLEVAAQRYLDGLARSGEAEARTGKAETRAANVAAYSDRWLTPPQAASLLGIGLRQLRNIAARGELTNRGKETRPRYSYQAVVALRDSRQSRTEAA